MNIQVTGAIEMYRDIISKMLQEYLGYLSAFEEINTDQNGEFIYPYLDLYWQECSRNPFLIEADDVIVGFALLRKEKQSNENTYMSVAEFYVNPSFQLKGIGEEAARLLFDRYPGNWRLSVITNNLNGLKFWRKVLRRYTRGTVEEQKETTKFMFSFSS